jgi:hypothetical protein
MRITKPPEKVGTAYSVPRRGPCLEDPIPARRRVDRVGCTHFFAPTTQSRACLPAVASHLAPRFCRAHIVETRKSPL